VEVNCKICHGETGDDGYGEPVHLDTGLYGAYIDGYRLHELTHVATV
jgi:hypothetical protein